MITIYTSPEKARLTPRHIEKTVKALQPRIQEIKHVYADQTYEDSCSSINLGFDTDQHTTIKKRGEGYTCDILIVVGIGGSNLGTLAVHEALQTKLHNEITNSTNVYFTDTTHPKTIQSIQEIIQKAQQENKRVVVNAVSKSGGTTETIANFELLTESLRQETNWFKDVVITTTKNSDFDEYAKNNSIKTLYIPPSVGGRYSVFSAVGLFPLHILGINTDELLRGSRDAVKKTLRGDEIVRSAAIKYLHIEKASHNTFLFDSDLESLGKWQRQLVGESLGKEGKGVIPTVSIGSTDLHSVAQYYLGGENNTYHEFVEVDTYDSPVLPNRQEFENLVEDIQGIPLSKILSSIISGVKTSFERQERPFTTNRLTQVDAYNIGWWMQYKMIETMLVGYMMDINPFNQPHVELYKDETRKLLRK